MWFVEDFCGESALLVAIVHLGSREQHDLKYQRAQLRCSAVPQSGRVQNQTFDRLLIARQPSTRNVHLCPPLGLGEVRQRPIIGAARERSPPAAHRAGLAWRTTSTAATAVNVAFKVLSNVSTHALNTGVALEHEYVMRCSPGTTSGTTIGLCVVRFCRRHRLLCPFHLCCFRCGTHVRAVRSLAMFSFHYVLSPILYCRIGLRCLTTT